jgi:hypothetical protein
MGVFDFLKRESTDERNAAKNLTTDVEFKKMRESMDFTIENQDGCKVVEGDGDLFEYVEIMLDDAEQFVTLCAPGALDGIRYVQACLVDQGIEVEIGVEDKEATKLYFKLCTEEELKDIFVAFYHDRFRPDKSLYEPVEFLC